MHFIFFKKNKFRCKSHNKKLFLNKKKRLFFKNDFFFEKFSLNFFHIDSFFKNLIIVTDLKGFKLLLDPSSLINVFAPFFLYNFFKKKIITFQGGSAYMYLNYTHVGYKLCSLSTKSFKICSSYKSFIKILKKDCSVFKILLPSGYIFFLKEEAVVKNDTYREKKKKK